MNKITNAEREPIDQRARQIVRLDSNYLRVTNLRAALDQLMSEFSVSEERARRHIAKAARYLRHPIRRS